MSEKEREKLTVFLHKGATGEWDFDILASDFDTEDLIEWGFDENELKPKAIEIPDPEVPENMEQLSECLVEIYCTRSDLNKFLKTLYKWDQENSVTINIS